jgi:hypothetical protein
MKILPFICPSSTALDLAGSASARGPRPGHEVRCVGSTKAPMKSDRRLQSVATHDFSDGWVEPIAVFVPGGPTCKCRLRRSGTCFH